MMLEFGFHCSCERCSSTADDLTALPCPHCAPPAEARIADGLLPASIASGERHPTGLLHYNPNMGSCLTAVSSDGCSSSSSSTAAAMQSPETQTASSEGPPSSSTAVTQLPWSCSSCGVALPDTNEALSGGTSSTMWAEVMEGCRAKASVITPGWDSSSSSNTAVSTVEDAVWETVYGLSLGHPLARKQRQVDAAKLEESFERVVGVINAASSLLGPDHGAVLYARVVLVGESWLWRVHWGFYSAPNNLGNGRHHSNVPHSWGLPTLKVNPQGLILRIKPPFCLSVCCRHAGGHGVEPCCVWAARHGHA